MQRFRLAGFSVTRAYFPFIIASPGRARRCARKNRTINRLRRVLDLSHELARSSAAEVDRRIGLQPCGGFAAQAGSSLMCDKGKIIKALRQFLDVPHESRSQRRRVGPVPLFRAETGPLSSLLFKRQEPGQF
jgi:hypothetical protein